MVAWAVFIILPAAFAYGRRRKLPAVAIQYFGVAYPIMGATFLLCIVWGKMQAGPMFQFNGYFFHGVYYFMGLLGIGVICSIPGRLLPLPVTAAICGVAGISASWMFRAPRLNEGESGLTLHRGVELALQQDSSRRPKLLVFEHYAWPEAAAVGLELQRRGIPFYVSPGWNFMFGRQHSMRLLGPKPEEAADIWWITKSGPGGVPVSAALQIFTQPAVVDPRQTEISFAGNASGFRYLISGVSVGNVEFAWTEEQRVAMKFQPEQAAGDVQVIFDVNIHRSAPPSPAVQPAEVFFNGQSQGVLAVSQRAPVSVMIAREVWNAAPAAVLELRFPQAVFSQTFSRPADDLWSAWALWGVRFKVQAPVEK
jgi:hypothetical protein